MRNTIKGAIAATAVLIGVAPDGAMAFSATDDIVESEQIGPCRVTRAVTTASGYATTYLINFGVATAYAGGAYWLFGDLDDEKTEITATMIAGCLGINENSVSYFVADGPDGSSFADDNLIGFGFVLSEDAGDFDAGTFHTFTVGTGSLPPPPPNTAPTADAGPDQTGIASAASVTLDGTGSSDPDDDTLSYAWTQTDSSGETVGLSDATAAQPTFTAPTLDVNDAAVTLTFSLVVTDDKGNASTADTVDITVNPPAPTPASEFEDHREDIKQVLVDEAARSLSSTLSANQRMTQGARNRFVADQR